MSMYTKLLEKAVTEITTSFKKRSTVKLMTGGRGAKLVAKEKQATNISDFELVTWLIIK